MIRQRSTGLHSFPGTVPVTYRWGRNGAGRMWSIRSRIQSPAFNPHSDSVPGTLIPSSVVLCPNRFRMETERQRMDLPALRQHPGYAQIPRVAHREAGPRECHANFQPVSSPPRIRRDRRDSDDDRQCRCRAVRGRGACSASVAHDPVECTGSHRPGWHRG